MKDRRLNPINLDDYKPLGEKVFEALREAIITQVLPPSERLMEVQLAEEMGVSRTPVREAIRKLEKEGFVNIMPRKGAYVASISLEDIRELYEIRGALEALAGSLAAERATDEELEKMEKFLLKEHSHVDSNNILATVDTDMSLHSLIYQAARNDRLINILNNLRGQLYRTKAASISVPGRKKESVAEHRRIIEALAVRDPELAGNLLLKHVENAEKAVISYFQGLNKPAI